MALKKSIKITLLLIIIAAILIFAYTQFIPTEVTSKEEGYPIYLFTASGCPHCADEKAFLESIKHNYNISIIEYEISKNVELYTDFAARYNIPRDKWGHVPALFIGDDYIVGYGTDETTGKEIERLIQQCPEACVSPEESGGGEAIHEEAETVNTISIFGKEIKIGVSTPLVLLAVLLGLVDSINPCVFIVMIILLGYLVGIGSKRLVLKAGAVFIAVTYAIYVFYMFGIFNVMSIIPFLDKIKLAVAVFALIAGVIFVKDFFFLHKGPSLKIPKAAGPMLDRLKRTTSMLGVAVLAAFASLVELPCTGGFPFIYATVMADKGISTISSIAYILWYNIFYVLPLFVLIGLVYWAQMKVEDMEAWRKKAARRMRLMGGIVMLALGIAILAGFL